MTNTNDDGWTVGGTNTAVSLSHKHTSNGSSENSNYKAHTLPMTTLKTEHFHTKLVHLLNRLVNKSPVSTALALFMVPLDTEIFLLDEYHSNLQPL